MTDPRSNAELEQCVYAGLALNPDFLRRVAALSELCRRLGEAEADRERLVEITHDDKGYWLHCNEYLNGRKLWVGPYTKTELSRALKSRLAQLPNHPQKEPHDG